MKEILFIAERCCSCGNCYAFFRELKMAKPGGVLLDEDELAAVSNLLDIAVSTCHIEALKMEDIF